MRSLLAYLLIFAVLLPSISPWGTIAYYHLNKDYIARVLCENRDKPQLHCDGQCYLAKQLKVRQDKQEKETTERVQNIPSLQLFCERGTTYRFAPSITEQFAQGHFAYMARPYAQVLRGLFRPPCA